MDSRDFAPVGYHRINKTSGRTQKVAVATFVMRGRQHLCVVAPQGDLLMLMTLRFAAEILPPVAVKNSAAPGKSAAITPAELAMAQKLVAGMSARFKPEAFKDTYRTDLKRRIEEKIKNKDFHSLKTDATEPSQRPKAQVIDLMEALRNSITKRAKTTARSPGKKLPAKARRRA